VTCSGRPVVARSGYAVLPAPKSFAIVQLPHLMSGRGGSAKEPECGA